MTYTLTGGGTGSRGERGSRDAWKGATSNLAVRDAGGLIVAWYERSKSFRCVDTVARFRTDTGWTVRRSVPADSTARTLREWFLTEVEARYGVKATSD